MSSTSSHIPWRLVIMALGAALAAYLAFLQVMTMVLYSFSPQWAPHLQSLEIKAWGFLALSVALGATALALFIRVIKRINEGWRRDEARSIETKDAELK